MAMTKNSKSVRGQSKMGDRVCKAPACTTKLASDNDSDYCEIHKDMRPQQHLRGELAKDDAELLEYAHFYSFALDDGQSLRRFREHVKGLKRGRVLEVTYDKDQERYIFHSKPGEMRGPVADVQETFLLPSGATMGCPHVCSGVVSGYVYQGVIASGFQHPTAILKGEDGCSGIIVQWIGP